MYKRQDAYSYKGGKKERKPVILIFGALPLFRILGIPKIRKIEAPKIPTGLPKIPNFCRAEKKPLVGSRRGIMKMVVFNLIFQNCLLIHPIPF